MKLNIETMNPELTRRAISTLFYGQEVRITGRYENTADFQIGPENEWRVYSLEALVELTHTIPMHKIRIY